MYYSDTREKLELVKRRHQKYYKDPTKLLEMKTTMSQMKKTPHGVMAD